MIPAFPGSRIGHEVDAESGCWQWKGAIAANGYGRLGIVGTRRTAVAHRFYYERLNGPVPTGCELDHLCRNRGCVNPAHLEVVTRTINVRRGASTKLTPEQVLEIRVRYSAGIPSRRRYQRGAVSMTQLAKEYGVGTGYLCRLLRGDFWKDVGGLTR